MTDAILQVILFVSATAAMWLVAEPGRAEKWGWLIGAVFQPLWLYVTFTAALWGMFALSVIYQAIWIRGAWKRWDQHWRKERFYAAVRRRKDDDLKRRAATQLRPIERDTKRDGWGLGI